MIVVVPPDAPVVPPIAEVPTPVAAPPEAAPTEAVAPTNPPATGDLAAANPALVSVNTPVQAGAWTYTYPGFQSVIGEAFGNVPAPQGQYQIVIVNVTNGSGQPASIPDGFFALKDAQGRVYPLNRAASVGYMDRFGRGQAADISVDDQAAPNVLTSVGLVFDVAPDATSMVLLSPRQRQPGLPGALNRLVQCTTALAWCQGGCVFSSSKAVQYEVAFTTFITWAFGYQKDTIHDMPVMLKNRHQIDKLRDAGRLVGQTLQVVNEYIKPGVTTLGTRPNRRRIYPQATARPLPIKGIAARQRAIRPFLARSARRSTRSSAMASRPICAYAKAISSASTSARNSTAGRAIPVTPSRSASSTPRTQKLVDTTREALMYAIEVVGPGKRLGDIGAAIQQIVEPRGFSIVREYTGHGIGRKLHEEPTVLHYGKAGTGLLLRPGMVFTIEPMVNIGKPETELQADGWTVLTADRSRSAQFEHTIAITEHGVEILSAP